MQEKIIQTKTCKQCNSNFNITDKDLEFYDKISPKFNGEKFQIPSPTLCPNCREQRRLVWRNDKNLYKRKCSATGKDIISMYSPDKKNKVYSQEIWWSDKWDALDYWLDFDFSKSFFQQFNILLNEVPHPSLIKLSSENSEYSNYNAWNKNSYLCFAWNYLENGLYCYNVEKSNNCTDSLNLTDCDISYESINSFNSSKIFFSNNSNNCYNSYFLENCDWCENCFMCYNLINKKYYIKNKKYTKNDYEKFINNINIWNSKILNDLKIEFKNLTLFEIKKNNNNKNSINCTWDYIYNSNYINNSYYINDWEKLKNVLIWFPHLENSYDCTYSWEKSSFMYEVLASGSNCMNILFCNLIIEDCSNIYYSDYCISSKNLFWCIWLKNKQYCILNKQYTKEEYEILVPKIIGNMRKTWEWWEFFPASISPFWYNETVAQEYYPLEKEEVINNWFNWSDYENPLPKVDKVIPANKLPDDIKDIPDDILNWAIECEVTKKPFRIISQELEFYRKHNLPVPKRHPDQRHLDRMALRNPRKLFDRKCDKCRVDMKTTYSPDREEIVYCEECYNKEVY